MAETPDTKTYEMPGGSVPDYQLWQSTTEQGTGRERAYTDWKGQSHPLKEGERFSVQLDRSANIYKAVVSGSDGERIVGGGPIQGLDINKGRLNDIIRAGAQRGSMFGKDLTLEDADRKDIHTIVTTMHEWLDPQIQSDSAWKDFHDRLDQAQKSGKLIALSPEFPPSWLVNGGEGANVDDTFEKGKWTVTVPERTYRLFYWESRADELERFIAHQNDELNKGVNIKGLSEPLRETEHFLRSINRLSWAADDSKI